MTLIDINGYQYGNKRTYNKPQHQNFDDKKCNHPKPNACPNIQMSMPNQLNNLSRDINKSHSNHYYNPSSKQINNQKNRVNYEVDVKLPRDIPTENPNLITIIKHPNKLNSEQISNGTENIDEVPTSGIRLEILGHINNEETTFILDSGAAISVINS